MNIIIGLFVIISALVIKHNYKVKGEVSDRIFKMCMAVGVFMFFSVQTFDNVWLVVMTASEVLLCAALLWVYRAQLIRESAAMRRKRAVRRANSAECRTANAENRARAKRVVATAA